MDAREGRAELRGAVARGDGVGLVQLLIGRPLPDDALQLIGDGLAVRFPLVVAAGCMTLTGVINAPAAYARVP